MGSASGGANALWLTEWLADGLELKPGLRVLDLGCGRATSSIFLQREFGVKVWATDLWFSASENYQRIRDAGVDDAVFPIHADARSLPFPTGFFDAIVSIDSFVYYGTDDLYLNYLARFVRPDGQIGIAGAGLMRDIDGPVSQSSRTLVGTEPLVPSFRAVVAAALGTHRDTGNRTRGYARRWLAAVARMATGSIARQRDRNSSA